MCGSATWPWHECDSHPRRPTQTQISDGTMVAMHPHRPAHNSAGSKYSGVSDHELDRGFGWGRRFQTGRDQVCGGCTATNSGPFEGEKTYVDGGDGGDASALDRSQDGGDVSRPGLSGVSASRVTAPLSFPIAFLASGRFSSDHSGWPESFSLSKRIDDRPNLTACGFESDRRLI